MEKETQIGLLIKKIHTKFETEINNSLVDQNLTRSQLEMLKFIKNQTNKDIEVNQIHIEKEFNLKNPTVSGILKRLEEKKYIKRTVSEKNASYKKIILTDEVNDILDIASKQGNIMEKKLKECLTKEEQKNLEYILNKIIKNI